MLNLTMKYLNLMRFNMLPSNQNYSQLSSSASRTLSVFMSQVYLWMMIGITISGVTAFAIAANPVLMQYIVQNRIIFYGLILFQLAAVVVLSAWVQKLSFSLASLLYVLYAALVGATFSVLFMVYTLSSISAAFFTTAFSFAGLSVFGYVTKRDLGPVGSFCMMGLFGMIGIMLISLFFPSIMNTSMQLTISTIGVIVFAGLTAYDTQRIKALQFQMTNSEQAKKGAIYGALILYLDFINLFLSILRLMGNRR